MRKVTEEETLREGILEWDDSLECFATETALTLVTVEFMQAFEQWWFDADL